MGADPSGQRGPQQGAGAAEATTCTGTNREAFVSCRSLQIPMMIHGGAAPTVQGNRASTTGLSRQWAVRLVRGHPGSGPSGSQARTAPRAHAHRFRAHAHRLRPYLEQRKPCAGAKLWVCDPAPSCRERNSSAAAQCCADLRNEGIPRESKSRPLSSPRNQRGIPVAETADHRTHQVSPCARTRR
jgi:hypothetical protein